MADLTVEGKCARCNGTGIDNPTPGGGEPGTCVKCNGTGYVEVSRLFCPSGVFNAYEVLECLDTTEYNALTATKKSGILLLLACGLVDLNDGKAGKTRLWNWFGAESTTVANLTALIAG